MSFLSLPPPPGRKQYARALELLLQAVTAPALAGNAIVVAAYKKYVLVCLLHLGECGGHTGWRRDVSCCCKESELRMARRSSC